jgi:phage host-nuclease inhibitor protein Gam
LEEAGHNCYFIFSGKMKTEDLKGGNVKWHFEGGAIHSNDLAALHYAIVGWLRRHTEDGRFLVLVEPVREFVYEMDRKVRGAAGIKPESED